MDDAPAAQAAVAMSSSQLYQAGRDLHVGAVPEPRAPTRTLPRDTASFTGRADELARLIAAAEDSLAEGRVVAIHSIDGMAGVGKTALAVHLAHRLAARFPDGQVFIRLHGHTPGQPAVSAADALRTLLTMVGVPVQRIPGELDARAAMWRDHLAGKRMLVVLDDAVGRQQVEALIPASPGCLVLITSRRRLTALEAAVTLSLDVLPAPEATALFATVAERGVSGAVDDLVRMCGHLPLAISLLAGRFRHRPTWSAADLVADLDAARDRLTELHAEDIAVAAAFDLSYRALPEDRQRFFRRLGLHPGTDLDVHSAAALAATGAADARSHLDALYDDHLIDEPSRGRYRMHDLLRAYAGNLVRTEPAVERERALERLLDHYEHTAARADQQIGGSTAPAARTEVGLSTRVHAVRWMRTEQANLFACVEHATANGHHRRVVRLAASMAEFLRLAGPWDRAVLIYRSAEAAAERCGDRVGRARSLVELGRFHQFVGNYRAAVDAHVSALDHYRVLGDRAGQVVALNHVGMARRMMDDVPQAVRAHTDAMAIAVELDDHLGQAFTLNELGIARFALGDYQGSLAAHRLALGIYDDFGDRRGRGDVLVELGIVLRLTGDHRGAMAALSDAVAGCRELGDGFLEAFALNQQGIVWRVTGDNRRAAEAHERALSLSRELGDRIGEAVGVNELGVVLRLTGNLPDATAAHTDALVIYRELGHRLGQAEALNHLGELLLVTGEPHEAIASHQRALGLAREVRSPLEEAHALRGTANCESRLGRTEVAAGLLADAQVIYRRIGAAEADLDGG